MTVDHNENYGRHILQSVIKKLKMDHVLDIGCGDGDDLKIVQTVFPEVTCYGIDFHSDKKNKLSKQNIRLFSLNLENESLPFSDGIMDFVIANQVLEHMKEIFWINHEIFRVLKPGGYLFLGVPNVLAFHNRLLSFFGVHPTCAKLFSAHLRIFSKHDTKLFYNTVGNGVAEIRAFYGSQFYPFSKKISRYLSSLFPNLSTSIFFLIRKNRNYHGEFVDYLKTTPLETNYFYKCM